MSSIGSILNNRYRLDKMIGEGGFARVFLATDLELDRQVAVKVLGQDWTGDKELLARFRNEARVIAALDHPNILLIYDFGIANGAPYLVMPYVSGGTFSDRMKQGPFTLDEVGFYMDQVGSALDYAHQRGIVHRDVKPSNLLIRSNGQLVLMDFGLAKLLGNVFLETQTGVFGTVAYMAPEQLEGKVSAASDIYMLGVILYQMLAGALPFEGNTNQILAGHLHLAPKALINQPTMQPVHPVVVRALDQVVTKVLAKLPVDRYPTCQALTSAYYRALKADPMRAARYYSRDRSSDIHDLSETLMDKDMAASQSPPPANLDATQVVPDPAQRKKILLKPPRLLVTTEPDKGFQAIFDLTGETLTLGRAKDNNICLPLATISRYHAVLNRINNEPRVPSYKIVQRQTINPLRFNSKVVPEKVLKHGDTIEIGTRGYADYIVKLTYLGPEYGFA